MLGADIQAIKRVGNIFRFHPRVILMAAGFVESILTLKKSNSPRCLSPLSS
jgi:hypothetical protein